MHPLKGILDANHHKSIVKIKEIVKNEKKLKKHSHLVVIGQRVYLYENLSGVAN